MVQITATNDSKLNKSQYYILMNLQSNSFVQIIGAFFYATRHKSEFISAKNFGPCNIEDEAGKKFLTRGG